MVSNKFDSFLKEVHQGFDHEAKLDSDTPPEQAEPVGMVEKPTIEEPNAKETKKATELSRRKRKPQEGYQDVFFVRVDFTHRKPLYITAATHRRLMRVVHLMNDSKATISSYVENILLHHLESFREDIDTIYRENSINPTEK